MMNIWKSTLNTGLTMKNSRLKDIFVSQECGSGQLNAQSKILGNVGEKQRINQKITLLYSPILTPYAGRPCNPISKYWSTKIQRWVTRTSEIMAWFLQENKLIRLGLFNLEKQRQKQDMTDPCKIRYDKEKVSIVCSLLLLAEKLAGIHWNEQAAVFSGLFLRGNAFSQCA